MNYYSPLHNFLTREEEFYFSDYLNLKASYKLGYNIENDGYIISKIEYSDVARCQNWLIIDDKKAKLNKSVILNTLLLSFWIYSPNGVICKVIFDDSKSGCSNILSRFQYNKLENNRMEYTSDDLKRIREYFSMLEIITITNGRLQTALSNTFQGCVSFNWKTAFLLYSAAAEAMLNYKRGYGITERLSKSYACLVETDLAKRKQEYYNFKILYNIRSEIIHGEINNNHPDDNLLNLSKFENILRRLWQIVLSDLNLIDILEKRDLERENHFKSIEVNFIP